MTDRQLLDQGICPDCGRTIDRYFVIRTQPWCKACDVYFTVVSGHVVRNSGATKLYNQEWEEYRANAFAPIITVTG